jgi:hypothetical protein
MAAVLPGTNARKNIYSPENFAEKLVLFIAKY